jgi:hypothetical protein
VVKILSILASGQFVSLKSACTWIQWLQSSEYFGETMMSIFANLVYQFGASAIVQILAMGADKFMNCYAKSFEQKKSRNDVEKPGELKFANPSRNDEKTLVNQDIEENILQKI